MSRSNQHDSTVPKGGAASAGSISTGKTVGRVAFLVTALIALAVMMGLNQSAASASTPFTYQNLQHSASASCDDGKGTVTVTETYSAVSTGAGTTDAFPDHAVQLDHDTATLQRLVTKNESPQQFSDSWTFQNVANGAHTVYFFDANGIGNYDFAASSKVTVNCVVSTPTPTPTPTDSCLAAAKAKFARLFDKAAASASISVTNGKLCEAVTYTLVSYDGVKASGPGYGNTQTRHDVRTFSFTTSGSAAIEAACQVDLIKGSDAPATLSSPYFTNAGTLVASGFNNDLCVAPTPVTSDTPTAPATSPVVVVPSETNTPSAPSSAPVTSGATTTSVAKPTSVVETSQPALHVQVTKSPVVKVGSINGGDGVMTASHTNSFAWVYLLAFAGAGIVVLTIVRRRTTSGEGK